LAVDLLKRLQRLQMNVDLAFVGGGPAAKEIAIANCGFKRGRGPKLERLGRLHVVVSIEEDCRLPGSSQRFRINQGVQVGRNHLNRFKSGVPQVISNPASAAFDIRFMFALGADAGNVKELIELGEVLITRTINPFSKIHKSPWGQ